MMEEKWGLERKAKLIQELMDELEIPALGADSSNQLKQIIGKLRTLAPCDGIDSKALGYSVESDLAIFFTCGPELTAEWIGEKTGDFLKELDEEVQGLHVVIFVKTMGEKWYAEKVLMASIKKQCRKAYLEQWEDRKRAPGVEVRCVLCTDSDVEEHEVCIEYRHESLRVPREAGPVGRREQRVFAHGSVINQAEARVYTARLADVAELYNRIGDVLFSQNVRYRITDVLGVESEMKRTLREQPDDFWFFNNGITLMVRNPANIHYNRSDRLLLSQHEPGDLSVINGAQTICAAAEFLYGDMAGDAGEAEQIREAAREARVLLRVVTGRNNRELQKKEADQISIALNRQKPISNEDIAYTCSAVEQINELCESAGGKEPYFYILKRGEENRGRHCYKLNEFGRAVRAYRDQKPGQARSLSIREILTYREQKAGTVYADFEECEDRSALFMQWYRPVIFTIGAVELYSRWSKTRDKEEDDPVIQAIAANGRYYFAAYLVYLLNGETEGNDYSAFEGKTERLNDEAFPLLEKYTAFFKEFYQMQKGEAVQPTSNDFKGDELYRAWITYTRQKYKRKLPQWIRDVKAYFLDEAEPEESL